MLQYHIIPDSEVHPGQPWTHAIAVDGWEMLSEDLIVERLVGVGSA